MKPQQENILRILEAGVQNLGFLLSGISGITPTPHFNIFQDWIAASHHAGMSYLSRSDTLEKRADPRLLLPDANSVICLAFPYLPANLSLPSPQAGFGRVASYAWGLDYHFVIPGLLAQLVESLTSLVPNSQFRVHTDSAPILERGYAAQAGMGWIGKNSCLINPEHGSYFLLAEIITDLELFPDAEMITDHCGTCTRCLDACPTGCILPDRTIDSNRCISYWTIENKGIIPQDLQGLVEEWVFGCDLCQMVCPWNLRFSEPVMNSLQAEPQNAWVDLAQELNGTPSEFEQKYSQRPISRAKHTGWLRNCIVAAGNSQAPEFLPLLSEILFHNPRAMLRCQAALALGNNPSPEIRLILNTALQGEKEEGVRQALFSLL